MMYVRFPLSLRQVEDLLSERAVVRNTRRPDVPRATVTGQEFTRAAPRGRPDPRRICGMGMMQDHRRPELPRQFPHLLAAPVPLAPGFHVGLGPRTEHVQVVAP